uniref:RHS repeat domain-containing protein n=1 Tax=Pseudomonas sp. Sample_10 TaxID=2448269 RepID=UPI0010357176
NQRIEPVNRYVYDSLYQLTEACGWEAGSASKGPHFSTFDDPAPRANFRQVYRYDAGGNLLELTHEGPQNHGHRMLAAAHSNRCLPVLEGVEPDEDDFRRGFDGNGNLLKLQPGQALAWDLRNQLGEVRPVVRDSGVNDRERYVYGADGMRLRKVRETLAHARTLVAETRYLPSLELRKYSGTGEVLQVISVQAGRSSVRVLHWDSEPPKDSANDQYRYHLNDHLGSCTLELDDDGEVISQERYHPFGTTAWFAGRGEVEASYRTVRYSGKERDATGFYYYGFRYYVAWWQRWLNPDPAGDVDGMNLFNMVGNQPVVFRDEQGLAPVFGEGMEGQVTTEAANQDRENTREPEFIYYIVKDLRERLSSVDERSEGRADLVANMFTHKVVLRTIVMTEPKSKNADKAKVSKYFNMINKYEWEFKQNYKYSDSGRVFANDIFRHQYKVAAQRNNNYGELPSVIRRSKVKNQITLDKTQGLESGSSELLEAFFQTPNGKTTQRVIEDFGLIATAVTKELNGKDLDFVVAVKPMGNYETVVYSPVKPISRRPVSKAIVIPNN